MARKLVHCPQCGFPLDEAPLPRSPKQHRAFFKMVKIAMEAWPESHDYQPRGLTLRQRFEDLRAWLICRAGWRVEVMRLDLTTPPAPSALVELCRGLAAVARETPTFPVERDGIVHFVQPKSISWRECSHEDFRPVFDEVLYIVEQETGVKVEFIKQELKQFDG